MSTSPPLPPPSFPDTSRPSLAPPPPRVLVVIGTRPEAIKMAPVVAALRRAPEADTRVVLTGQHTALVDQALEVFAVVPDYDLEIMREGQSLYDVAHACLDGLRGVVEDSRPHALLVQGDTATVCFGALVGFFEDVRVGHVEAGLRSGHRRTPFPEEMFRRVADLMSDWHFAPTTRAAGNLLREGTDPASVHVTGNTVVDALVSVSAKLGAPRDDALAAILSGGRRLVLLTAHRRESFGEPLRRLFGAVRALADAREDVHVLYPVHPNPNVLGPAEALLSRHPRIHLTRPLDYLDLVLALREATLVLTDSGGIQEEAPTFGTPVLVLREVTERPEGVEAGAAELVGTDAARILERALALLDEAASGRDASAAGGGADRAGRAEGAKGAAAGRAPRGGDRSASPAAAGAGRGGVSSPYGDGRAGERIADIVLSDLLGRPRRTEDWRGSGGEDWRRCGGEPGGSRGEPGGRSEPGGRDEPEGGGEAGAGDGGAP